MVKIESLRHIIVKDGKVCGDVSDEFYR